MRFTPVNGNTCKVQVDFVEMLETQFSFFCEELSLKQPVWHSEQPLFCCGSLLPLCQLVLRCFACVHVQTRLEVKCGGLCCSHAKQANGIFCTLNWTFVSHVGDVLRCDTFELSGCVFDVILSFCSYWKQCCFSAATCRRQKATTAK